MSHLKSNSFSLKKNFAGLLKEFVFFIYQLVWDRIGTDERQTYGGHSLGRRIPDIPLFWLRFVTHLDQAKRDKNTW